MSKRPRNAEEEDRSSKRPKHESSHKGPAVEEIHFARQLQQLLTFRQDAIHELRSGIVSFKAFLDSILYPAEQDDNRGRKLSILHEYLDSETTSDPKDTERPFLGQLWQAWSFASQNNNDQLASSISAIFALLLKTLSSLLDFREHGLLLCRTALQHQHLRLLKRGLDAPRHKEFVISPCLRLLIEITSFDGGVLAKEVYKRREQTFDHSTTRRNLGILKTDGSEEDAIRRPSIRTQTIRYVLALLKYLHEGGKNDLLKSRPLCISLFHHLANDPAELVKELLAISEQSVLKDEELPRSAKATLLVQQNLERVTEVATRSPDDHPAAERAMGWLKAVCTKPLYGILRTSGWYPPGSASFDSIEQGSTTIDLGLDSIEFYDREGRPDVRNTTLLSWIQTLRPHSNTSERELVLTCFASAPELVAAYFSEKTLLLEPKLTNTWIGYASFLFEVIQLPVPLYLGYEKEKWAELPPQTSIVMDNILPQPLTQKMLTRCLNQNSELITFFAIRILLLACEKLSKIRFQLELGSKAPNVRTELWQEASERLLDRFIDQCPPMKDVIATFRKIADDDDHALQREAITRLLQLYYEAMPLQAREEQFDVSMALTSALARRQYSAVEQDETASLRALELEHLLEISRHSPGMRWFSKQGSLEYSPLLTLLRIHAKDRKNRVVRELVYHVLLENNILNNRNSCDVLVASLVAINDDSFSALGPFLDDCLLRATRQPVKYLDDFESIASRVQDGSVTENMPGVFIAVLLEQTPFVLAKPKPIQDHIMLWTWWFLELLLHHHEWPPILQDVRHSLGQLDGFPSNTLPITATNILDEVRMDDTTAEPDQLSSTPLLDSIVDFADPPIEPEDHPELFRWTKKEINLALEDGDISALIRCLCSKHPDIRTQALSQLYKLENQLQNSTVEDKLPIYVLIGELIETFEQHYLPKNQRLPYLAGTFATRALRVQISPTHYMYPKVNAFLNKGPEWRVQKMPGYWLQHVALSQPEEDAAYWKEVVWVLHWLVDGLRTTADMEILRKSGVFEKVMSLYSSPGAEANGFVRETVLELLWRATFVEDGSTTLITRFGVLSWLDMLGKADGGAGDQKANNIAGMVKALRKRIDETCDRKKIGEWSGLKHEKSIFGGDVSKP